MVEAHWENWIDKSLPALNDQTPRQASKTKKGKELLEGLLLSFQKNTNNKPEFDPDLALLRRKLMLCSGPDTSH